MSEEFNYYDVRLLQWKESVSQFANTVDSFKLQIDDQCKRQDRLAEVLESAEDCTPENHEEKWRAVWELFGWNADAARKRYLDRRLSPSEDNHSSL